jgi:hypothetical protein
VLYRDVKNEWGGEEHARICRRNEIRFIVSWRLGIWKIQEAEEQ